MEDNDADIRDISDTGDKVDAGDDISTCIHSMALQKFASQKEENLWLQMDMVSLTAKWGIKINCYTNLVKYQLVKHTADIIDFYYMVLSNMKWT